MGVGAMELRHVDAEMLRFAADLVERDEPVINVERRILQPLRHDRPGALLEFHHKVFVLGDTRRVRVRRELEQQNVAQKIEHRPLDARVAALGQRDGTVDHGAVLRTRG